MRVSAYFTLESGSTTTTGLDIQSRTVLGMFSSELSKTLALSGTSHQASAVETLRLPGAKRQSAQRQIYVYFTTNSTESIASNEPSFALRSCTSIRMTEPDNIFPNGISASKVPGAPGPGAETEMGPAESSIPETS